jgi:hypothetical protein
MSTKPCSLAKDSTFRVTSSEDKWLSGFLILKGGQKQELCFDLSVGTYMADTLELKLTSSDAVLPRSA